MNTRNTSDIADFTQDLYDLMGRNTGVNGITPKQFFAKWVEDDKAFMISDEDGKGVIYLDGLTITVTANQ